MKNIQKSLLAALIVAGYAVNTQAAVTGQVDVKLNISTGCTVGGSQTEGNMNKFGTLDFGKTSGTWNNVLTAEVASAATGGNISVTCDGTDPVDFTVAIDGGERTDRTLKNTASADVVAYNVYRDAARTNLYVVNSHNSSLQLVAKLQRYQFSVQLLQTLAQQKPKVIIKILY